MSAPIIPSMALGRARTAAAPGGIICADSFENGTLNAGLGDRAFNTPIDYGGWTQLSPIVATDTIQQRDPGDNFVKSRRSNPDMYAPVATFSATDYYVQCNMLAPAIIRVGLFFNRTDGDNYCYLDLSQDTGNWFRLYEVVATVPNLLYDGPSAGVYGSPTIVRAEVRGQSINLFIDAVEQGSGFTTAVAAAPLAGFRGIDGGSTTFIVATDFELGTL